MAPPVTACSDPRLPPTLRRLRARILACARSTLVLTPGDRCSPVRGGSRIAGRALLPRGFRWSHRPGRRPDLLLQLDLADLAAHDEARMLPRAGMLSFFFDLTGRSSRDPRIAAGAAVVYVPPGVPLVEHPTPARRSPTARVITLRPTWNLPAVGSHAFERLCVDARLTPGEVSAWGAYVADCADRCRGGAGRLLGHHDNLWQDLQVAVSRLGDQPPAPSRRRARDLDRWVLLFQLDAQDDGVGLRGWGIIQFWIRRADLRARRFDRALCLAQAW